MKTEPKNVVALWQEGLLSRGEASLFLSELFPVEVLAEAATHVAYRNLPEKVRGKMVTIGSACAINAPVV